MEKVYALTTSDIYHWNEEVTECFVFSTLEKARETLKEYENYVRNEFIDDDDWVIETGDNSFCAYIEGRYIEDHHSAVIKEIEIDAMYGIQHWRHLL